MKSRFKQRITTSIIAVLASITVLTTWHTGKYIPAFARNNLLENQAGVQAAGTQPTLPINGPIPIPVVFSERFDGEPAKPLSWRSDNWDFSIHSRGLEQAYTLTAMQASHGPNCEAPPNTHLVETYADSVYQCKNHLMTAINEAGYGVIYMTPRYMVDFSEGEAVIRFDVSTLRKSNRDWWDIWITPYQDHLQLPLENAFPDLSGEPRNGLHFRLDSESRIDGYVIRAFQATPIPPTDAGWQGYDTFLTPDERRRDTFELRISQNHVQVGMPGYGFYWIDTHIAPLAWDTGIVQIGHHSYNPTKCEACSPGTWHWDNVYIEPAIPFSMQKANRRYVDPTTPSSVHLPSPTPGNAHLRFAAVGKSIEVSFDHGVTWQAATSQSQEEYTEGKFWSYWMRIPAGVQQVSFRGDDWYGGTWHVRDISVWSLNTP